MKLSHILYKSNNLSKSVKKFQNEGFKVEYGSKHNPNNALSKYFIAPGQTSSATNLKTLGDDFGALKGYQVPERIYNDLTRKVVGKEDGLAGLVQSAYYGALRLKGFSQYSKTVLSPITQVRNVTTASALRFFQSK